MFKKIVFYTFLLEDNKMSKCKAVLDAKKIKSISLKKKAAPKTKKI